MYQTKKKKQYANKTRKNKDISIIKKTNRVFESQLNYPLIKTINNEFKQRMSHEQTSLPSLYKKYKYYYKIKRGENYPKYYIIDNNNKHKCILDLENIGKSNSFFSVSSISFSNDETFMFFSVDTVGNRFHTIYKKDFFSDKLTKIISDVDGDVKISPDCNYMYYLKMNPSMRAHKLFSYDLQTKIHDCLFTEKDDSFSLGLEQSMDRNYIKLYCVSWESTHTYIILNNQCKLLYKKEKDLFYSLIPYLDTWYIIYTKNDTSKIIYTVDNFKTYHTLVHNKSEVEYEECIIKGHYLCCVYKQNGYSHLLTVNLITKKEKYLNFNNPMVSFSFPGLSNLDICNPIVIIDVFSYLQPKKTIEVNCVTNKITTIKTEKINNYQPNKYEEKLIKVNNKLCITMLYRKDKYKKNMKCLLYGYGAYKTNIDPEFDSQLISLLDRGFLYCIAHVRGGGFHGDRWYKEGKLLNKMNTFKDFIECARYLIRNKYTESKKLCIWGRSAGGLLIGATLNMAPELFQFAILGVPFVDVINTMKDNSKPLTLEEYKEWGNPNIKKYESYMEKYDPMRNINLKSNYPNVYIYSNLEDTLVDYKEPFNYYMKMKEADVFKNKEKNLYMNINLKYGHTQSSKRYENLNEQAIIYSMIVKQISN
jgi:oligopeptidase B